jgi:c-di-GMP-binding flagellar brake protein YcgR
MSIHAKTVNILDISLGGVKFTYGKSLELQANSVVEVHLDVGGVAYNIDAMILRTWKGEAESFGEDLSFAAAEFLNVTRTFEQELSRKIRDIERENLTNRRWV